MRVIIDISEETYIKANAGILGSLGEIIANGTPIQSVTNAEEAEVYPIKGEEE